MQKPSHDFRGVIDWHNFMECILTWEEMLEIEYFRELGICNMFSAEVPALLTKMGLFAAAAWHSRCKLGQQRHHVIYHESVKMYEKTRGPIASWITADVADQFHQRALAIEEDELQRALLSVRAKRAAKCNLLSIEDASNE